MNRTSITMKKHLGFESLRQSFSDHLLNIEDHRKEARCTHSLHDSVMSGFACMFFQDPSLSQFQLRMEEAENKNNLRTLFAVETIPKDTQLRDIIDNVESEALRPIFKDYFERLRRSKYLETYQILPRHYICAIDGVYHHSSDSVHCDQCLTKRRRNGSVSYRHGVCRVPLCTLIKNRSSP